MGSCLSSRKRSHALSSADEVELLAQFKDLRMSMFLSEADFIKLYRYFLDANVNENGCINLTEFLGFFDLPRNRISKRAFDMFRDDNETGITFKQWVFAIWNFCTTDSSALSIFAFQLYDKTGKGTLDLDDITHMLHELFGRDYESNPLARELMKSLLETDYRGNRITAGVTAGQFAKVAVRARNLMYQAFKLQRAIQSKVFGIGHWADKTLEREELQRTGGLNLQQVLDLVNAGRRRAQGHVVRGGVIMPYGHE